MEQAQARGFFYGWVIVFSGLFLSLIMYGVICSLRPRPRRRFIPGLCCLASVMADRCPCMPCCSVNILAPGRSAQFWACSLWLLQLAWALGD